MEALHASLARLRQQATLLDPTGDKDLELPALVGMHKATLAHASDSVAAFAAIDSTLAAIKGALDALTQSRTQTLCESRCISSLKVLSSNKEQFKQWHEKLVNAVAQTFGAKWRKFIEALDSRLDQDKKFLSDAQLREISEFAAAHPKEGDFDRMSEQLYYVLVEKTEGEAALRVASGTPGHGLMAYRKVYLW